jgi:hypothetical protein
VSRRGDVAADVAGGASFVDNRDILLDWRKVGRLRPSYSSTLRSGAVDNNRLHSMRRSILKIRSLTSHELPSSMGNTLSRCGLRLAALLQVTWVSSNTMESTDSISFATYPSLQVIFSKVEFLPGGSPSLLSSPELWFTSCYPPINFSFLSLIP